MRALQRGLWRVIKGDCGPAEPLADGVTKIFLKIFCEVSNSKLLLQDCCLDRNDHPEHHHLSFSFHTSSLEVSGSIQRDRLTFEMRARQKDLAFSAPLLLARAFPSMAPA